MINIKDIIDFLDTMMNQITNGENSLIELGAVVLKVVEDHVVVAEVPGTIIKRFGVGE